MISSSAKRVFSCVTVIIAATAVLTGCARGIPDAGLNVDRSMTTASVQAPVSALPNNKLGLDADTFQDGETIANAVSAVQFTGKSIPWQNTVTGSSGEIIAVNDVHSANGDLCRHFSALRSSYDGIRNYTGSACLDEIGLWHLTSFNPG